MPSVKSMPPQPRNIVSGKLPEMQSTSSTLPTVVLNFSTQEQVEFDNSGVSWKETTTSSSAQAQGK